MRVIYRKIRHARYLYIKRNVEKVWGARYTLSARYISKNTVHSSLQELMTVDHVTDKLEQRYARLDRLPKVYEKLQPSIRHRCFAEYCCYLVRGGISYIKVDSADVSGRAV